MERKVWVVAAVGFASALAIYGTSATHGQRADDGRLKRLARLEALMDEGKVQYRPSFFRKKVQVHIEKEQIAGLEPVKSVTEIAPPVVKDDAAKKAADKKAADEKKKKEDEAKKKKQKKKKKKKAKGEAAPENAPASSDSKDDKKPSDPSTDNGNLNPAGGAYAGGGAFDPNKTPESLEDWLKYLLRNPSFEKTSKFIQLKQIGTVKDDVFYPVVEKMLLTNVATLRSLAVMALGSTPSLASYEALFSIGNEASMDDKTRSSALHFLKVYERVDYVQILATAVSVQNNVPLNNFAIEQISETLDTNLQASTAATTPEASSTPRAPASSAVKRYEAVAAALRAAAGSTTDAGVRSNADSLASRIDALLPG